MVYCISSLLPQYFIASIVYRFSSLLLHCFSGLLLWGDVWGDVWCHIGVMLAMMYRVPVSMYGVMNRVKHTGDVWVMYG